MAFDYSKSGYAIREDIPDAHRAVWRMIAEPGCWWSSEDRIAFIAEARNARFCEACRRRREALSPNGDFGPHLSTTHLPDIVIDTVHRVTTDPARLSRSWLDGVNAAGVSDDSNSHFGFFVASGEAPRSEGVPPSMDFPVHFEGKMPSLRQSENCWSDEQYVELLGVVVAAISIDGFHRALGLPLEPLPAAVAGSPSGYRPPGAADSGAWVKTVQPEHAGESEADLYPGGRSANVISAMSLVPDSVRMLLRLSDAQYLPLRSIRTPNDNANSALSRCQIELLAGRVSSLSECFY